MSGWDDLDRELDAWRAAGKTATFWWRDDDAVAPTLALDRLLDFHRRHRIPVALAVIPARAEPALAVHLAGAPDVTVVQHGWAHLNHAPPGRPKAELGADRPVAFVLGELARGMIALDRLFGASWLKMLVPPHNRIVPELARALPQAGYSGLSTHNPRRGTIPGLVQVNTHIDIMEWTTTRAFLGEAPSLALAVAHLAARREGRVDAAEPTGLLTHHLAHDEAAWAFTDRFLARTAAHPTTRYLDPRAIFGGA